MFYVPFFLEHVHRGADGRVARGVWHLGHDLGDRGLALSVEDVHDLPFSAGELCAWGRGFRARSCVRHDRSVLDKQQCAAYLALTYEACQ